MKTGDDAENKRDRLRKGSLTARLRSKLKGNE